MADQEAGNTMLHAAAKEGKIDTVRELIDSRRFTRELSETNRENWLPLHFAVDNNHAEIVSDLVAAMIDGGHEDKLNCACSYPLLYGYREQWTALHIAVYRGHVDCIARLKKLDSTIADRRDYRPVHLAAESRSSDVLETYLGTFARLDDVQLNVTNVYGLTPLMLSAALGHVKAVALLVAYGADVGVTVPDGSTDAESDKRKDLLGQNVLHMIVKKSVEEPNSVDKYRAVYRAIVTGGKSTATMTSMMKHVARCSFRPRFERKDMTAVEFGAAIGAVDLTSDMIRHLSRDSNDAEQLIKCLHVAANYGHAHTIRVIVKTLSRLGLSNRVNDKLDFPLEFGYRERWTALHVAVYRGHVDSIKELSSLDPLIPDKRNYCAVHLAAESKTRNVLEAFLQTFSHKNDPQLDTVNSFGLTPLMLCAALGNADGVKLLVDYGADVEIAVPVGSTQSERAKRTIHLGQNVLHMIVKKSAEEPNNVAKYLEIYQIITQPYVENNLIPNLNRNLLQSKGTCFFGQRFRDKPLTVMQFAAAVGAADMLDAMVDTLLADNACKEYCDLALQYLVPSSESVGDEKHKSCLELISSHGTLSEMVNMERIQPMTTFVGKFAQTRTIALCILLVFHMIHMSFLTHVTTTTHAGNLSNSTSALSGDTPTPCPSSQNSDYYALFLLWPLLLFIYELFCGVISVVRTISSRNNHDSLLPEQSQYRIVYLDFITHIATVVFSLLMISWYLYGRQGSGDCTTFDPRRRIGLSATLLVWGWMQTLEYIRYPQKLHTFVAILKLIFIKDVFYISLIYAFVLVGFAAAIYVYLLTDDVALEMTFTDCIYHVYTTMLGDGKLFDNDVVSASDSHMVRSVFAVYLCLSIVVLLNMLIAMMNNRYSNVLDIRRSLWYIETVNSIAWASYVLRFDRCRCVFGMFAAGIKKPIKVEPNEDEFRRLHDRIDELEANFQDVRRKLEESLKMNGGQESHDKLQRRSSSSY